MKRSDFLKLALAAGAGLRPAVGLATAEKKVRTTPGPLPRRPLGRTGEYLSIIGFGGNIIKGEEQSGANRMIREAYEQGINYFDVAPEYGNAEDLMGEPLEPFRKEIFLACKTARRDAASAQQELETSLKKLRTDYFDLYQLHHIMSKEDIDTAFGPGGAMETLARAKEKGLVRFLGFSAHTVEAAFAAMERFDFDTIMFPINYISAFKGNFGPQVIEKAREKGMGILAIKPGARCPRQRGEERTYRKCWYRPFKTMEEVSASYSYTLSFPVTSALAPQEEALHKMAVEAGKTFIPLSDSDREALKAAATQESTLFSYPEWKG
jgi:aryl-alcohol dehydrogenase-like predicted oxidoreductase